MNLPKLKYFEDIFKYLLNIHYVLDSLFSTGDIAMVSADRAFVSGHYFIMKLILLETPKKLNKTNLGKTT